MALNQIQQVYEAIQRSKRPLIVARRAWEPDTLTAGLGIFKLAEKLEKQPDFLLEDYSARPNLRFLPHLDVVKPGLENMNKFVIKLDTSRTKFQDLSYDLKGDILEIYLAPQGGTWSERDIKTQTTEYKYDLVISVDTPDLESIGKTYDNHSDFFYRTPIINIDSNPANEHYGQINHVDITATSASEVVFGIYDNINRNFIDEDMATLLLAGMIAKTRSFRAPNVTPQTLATASQLTALGARREEIIHNLYRTRTIPTLKLWGRALARLRADESLGLVWTMLTRDDFSLSGAGAADLDDIVSELIVNSPRAAVVLILYEHENHVCGVLHAEKPHNAAELARPYGSRGTNLRADFTIPEPGLTQAEEKIIGHLKNQLAMAGK
ncbi:MAG: hypothetical protein PHW53_02170 [Patescibacteria group bacterium]|nr:hypothetical protein [Patescibacteria group bacterium]